MKIAIQGYEGSFHHAAVAAYFTHGTIDLVPCDTFVHLSEELLCGSVDVAMMAIENSIAGSILPNYNILQNRELKVVGEVFLSIQQCLVAIKGARLSEIDTVSSHPMALLQCEQWLSQNGRSWRVEQSEDTALSARRVAQTGCRNMAAIASRQAAELYGLDVLAEAINMPRNNFTRFLVVARVDDGRFDSADANKASMFFKVAHERGALGRILKIVELYELNMTKLQSYPIPSDPFRYNFHLDVEFSDRESLDAARLLMDRHCAEFSVYGIYKQGSI